MTYKHFNLAVDGELPFDSATQRFIFLEACFRSDNRGIIRHSQSELSSLMLCSLRTIAREFQRLQEVGLLTKEAHGRYKVIVAPLNEVAQTTESQEDNFTELDNWIEEHSKIDKSGNEVIIVPQSELLLDYVLNAIKEGTLIKDKMVWDNEGNCFNVYTHTLAPNSD